MLALVGLTLVPQQARASASLTSGGDAQKSNAITGQKFFPLTKVRTYKRGAVAKPYIASKNTGMVAVGNGHYFPLPRRAANETPSPLPNAGRFASGETKPLPQAQAQHILSLFEPDAQLR